MYSIETHGTAATRTDRSIIDFDGKLRVPKVRSLNNPLV